MSQSISLNIAGLPPLGLLARPSSEPALRRAILQYGPCRLFYCDNGKDFRRVARVQRALERECQSEEAVREGAK